MMVVVVMIVMSDDDDDDDDDDDKGHYLVSTAGMGHYPLVEGYHFLNQLNDDDDNNDGSSCSGVANE